MRFHTAVQSQSTVTGARTWAPALEIFDWRYSQETHTIEEKAGSPIITNSILRTRTKLNKGSVIVKDLTELYKVEKYFLNSTGTHTYWLREDGKI